MNILFVKLERAKQPFYFYTEVSTIMNSLVHVCNNAHIKKVTEGYDGVRHQSRVHLPRSSLADLISSKICNTVGWTFSFCTSKASHKPISLS